eukprot:scaffold2033_cov367-Prasinococcus_capsulatus_cf.AAC.11
MVQSGLLNHNRAVERQTLKAHANSLALDSHVAQGPPRDEGGLCSPVLKTPPEEVKSSPDCSCSRGPEAGRHGVARAHTAATPACASGGGGSAPTPGSGDPFRSSRAQRGWWWCA